MLKRLKKVDYVDSSNSKFYSATEKLKRLLMLDKSFKEEQEKLNKIKEEDDKSFNSLKKIFLFVKRDSAALIFTLMLIMSISIFLANSNMQWYIDNKVENLNLSLSENKEKVFNQFINKELLGKELTLTEKYNLFENFLLDNEFIDISKKIDTFELGGKNNELGLDILILIQKNEKVKNSLKFNKKLILFFSLLVFNYIYLLPVLSRLLRYKEVKRNSEIRKIELSKLSKNMSYFEFNYIKEWSELNISDEKLTFKEIYEKYYISENNSKLDNKLIKLAIIENVPDKVIFKNIFKNNSGDFLDVSLKNIEEKIKENLSIKDK